MRRRPTDRERGTSSLELVLYLPLLMFIILVAVQAALLYLGNAAAGAAARETARAARLGGSSAALADGLRRGRSYLDRASHGLLEGTDITVRRSGAQEITVTVTGQGVALVPGVPGRSVKQVVVSPVEAFRSDR